MDEPPSTSRQINWLSCVGVVLTILGGYYTATSPHVWLALLRMFDQEQDGDIELAEILSSVVGKALGLAYFSAMQIHRYASILFVVGSFATVYATVLTLVKAWQSRLVVRYHINATDDLIQPLRFFFMQAQLPQARRLEVSGARHVERDVDPKGRGSSIQESKTNSVNKRLIPCLSTKTWRKKEQTMSAFSSASSSSVKDGPEGEATTGSGSTAAPEPRREFFEVSVDARFQAHLLTFDPATRKIGAAGAGEVVSLLGILSDALAYLFLRSGPRRVWFSVSEDTPQAKKGPDRSIPRRYRGRGGRSDADERGLVLTLPRQQYQTALKTICEAARVVWARAKEKEVANFRLTSRMNSMGEPGYPYFPTRENGAVLEPKRAIDSFALPAADRRCTKEIEDLVRDYDDFVGRMLWYRHRGIPYRRGYLLHGRPGCGKTTFAKMLASRNAGGLYIMDLAESKTIGLDDDNISDIIRTIPPRSVLLLKNIDRFVKERGNKKGTKKKDAEAPKKPELRRQSTDLGGEANEGEAKSEVIAGAIAGADRDDGEGPDTAASATASGAVDATEKSPGEPKTETETVEEKEKEKGKGTAGEDVEKEEKGNGEQLAEGSNVTVRYKGKGKPNAGTIKRKNEDGTTFEVVFNDGDSDMAVPKELITLAKAAAAPPASAPFGSRAAPAPASFSFGMPPMLGAPMPVGMPPMLGAPMPAPMLPTQQTPRGADRSKGGRKDRQEEDDTEEEEDEGEDEDEDEEDEGKKGKELGYSAVLNALDGALANNQGLTVIMTTNNYAKLTSPEFAKTSEALFRPGRVDLRAGFNHPDESQLRQFFAQFFADERGNGAEGEELTALTDSFIDAWPMEEVKEVGLGVGSEKILRVVRLSKHPFRQVKNYMLKCAFKGAAWAAQKETVAMFESELEKASKVELTKD